jgi:hypothetical protein
LGAKGFSHKSHPMADGSWRIEFTPIGVPQGSASAEAFSCPGH